MFSRYFASLIILLVWLPVLTRCSSTEIIPGLHYEHLSLNNPPQSIHLLIADPAKVKIDIGLADTRCASARTTTEIAKHHNAVAAINAGFFGYFGKCTLHEWIIALLDCIGYSNYKAFPLWTLKLNNHYYALSHNYTGTLGWNDAEQRPLFSALKTTVVLTINRSACLVKELNKPNTNGPALYSSGYDTKTPHFYAAVTEIVINEDTVTKIHRASHGDTPIPDNGYIYVVPGVYEESAHNITSGDSGFGKGFTHTEPRPAFRNK